MLLTPKDYENIKRGLIFWLKRWEHNPLAYVIECVGDTPTHQQAEILKALPKYRFVAVKSGHGIGKTRLEGWLDSWWLDTRMKRCVITGAGGDALKDTIWAESAIVSDKKWQFLADKFEITAKKRYSKEVENGWFTVIRTASKDNTQALAGFHDCLFMIDEASAVVEGVFEVARGAMGDPHNYGLMLGNPTKTSGYFYQAFQGSKTWHCLSYSSTDSMYEQEYSYDFVDAMGDIREITVRGRQTQAWVDDMKREFGETSNTYKYRVLGEFASGSADMVVEKHWMKDVFAPTKIRDKKRKRVMGVDVGYTGNDPSAIAIRQGDDVIHIDQWRGNDTVVTTQKVIEAFETHECDVILVDSIGVGAGVYDNLKHAGYPVKHCDVRERVPKEKQQDHKKTKCKLLRDWLWWQARLYFKQRPVRFHGDPNEGEGIWGLLVEEVAAPTYAYEGRLVVVESKDKLKERGVKSPNIADALNMTFMVDWKTGKGTGQQKTKSKLKFKKPVASFKTA